MAVTLFTVVAIYVIMPVVMAGDLEPPTAPAPTMKTLDEVEARIPIPGSDTPVAAFVIDNSGSYYLTGDRTANAIAISVNADNVTIDLNGYSLIGPGTGANVGVYMSGRGNVEVRNGTVRNFGREGIRENSSSGRDNRIINVRAISNGLAGSFAGISLAGKNSLVKDCTSSGNTGFGIYAGNGSTVTGNTCCDNGSHGITTEPGSTVIGNTVSYNQKWGIYLGGNNLADQNTAYNNNQSGGIYGNMNVSAGNTYGTNHAP